MQSSSFCASTLTSLILSPKSGKNLSKVSNDDFKLNSELTKHSKKFNIGEIKESLLNSKTKHILKPFLNSESFNFLKY